MTQGIAVGCWRFLKMCPNMAGSCQFDFLEIFSGPNAPTTAAVVKILGRARSLECGLSSFCNAACWFETDYNIEEELEDESSENDTSPTHEPQGSGECASPPASKKRHQSYHLLEDVEVVDNILRSLPTEEYYSILRQHIAHKYSGIRPDVAEHLCELEEFFDVCLAVGFSLGVGKMELLKIKVKLLGEFVTRAGRQQDPSKVQAIKDWGKITRLKEVQEFLGTTNYSRLFMGPKYAAAAEGLRRYVKEGDSAFP